MVVVSITLEFTVCCSSILTVCAPIFGTNVQKTQVVWFIHGFLG